MAQPSPNPGEGPIFSAILDFELHEPQPASLVDGYPLLLYSSPEYNLNVKFSLVHPANETANEQAIELKV